MNAQAPKLFAKLGLFACLDYRMQQTQVSINLFVCQAPGSVYQKCTRLSDDASIAHFGLHEDRMQKVLLVNFRFEVMLFDANKPKQALNDFLQIKVILV